MQELQTGRISVSLSSVFFFTPTFHLRLLRTFAGVLREKIRMRPLLKQNTANYISRSFFQFSFVELKKLAIHFFFRNLHLLSFPTRYSFARIRIFSRRIREDTREGTNPFLFFLRRTQYAVDHESVNNSDYIGLRFDDKKQSGIFVGRFADKDSRFPVSKDKRKHFRSIK